MKRIVLLGGVVAVLASFGCTVSAGVGVGGGGGGDACVEIFCGNALVQGLPVQGDRICDATSDNLYSDLINCACGAGAQCADVCGDNLCVDAGESPACGDCLNVACSGEHTSCAND